MDPKLLWKRIPGPYSKYRISVNGDVYSLHSRRLLFQKKMGNYMAVNLTDDNKKYGTYRINRCVAMAFIPNPNDLPIVDHINKDCLDNNVNNLRWVSHSLSASNKGKMVMKGNAVNQYALDGHFIKRHISFAAAGRDIGAKAQTLRRASNSKTHIYDGYMWIAEVIPTLLEHEEWKAVNYPQLSKKIHVSNMGRVKKGTRIFQPTKEPNGYVRINLLCINGKKRMFPVHRLVAYTFLGPRELTVNHKNQDRADNRLSNLEYATSREQVLHSYASGTRKSGGHASRKAILLLDGDGDILVRYDSVKDAAKATGCSRHNISGVCNGVYKQINGCSFRFERESLK